MAARPVYLTPRRVDTLARLLARAKRAIPPDHLAIIMLGARLTRAIRED